MSLCCICSSSEKRERMLQSRQEECAANKMRLAFHYVFLSFNTKANTANGRSCVGVYVCISFACVAHIQHSTNSIVYQRMCVFRFNNSIAYALTTDLDRNEEPFICSFHHCDCSQQFQHTQEFRCEQCKQQKSGAQESGGKRMGKMESYYLNLPLNLNTRENSYHQQRTLYSAYVFFFLRFE